METDAKGKQRKTYRQADIRTPYEALKALPEAERYLRPGGDLRRTGPGGARQDRSQGGAGSARGPREALRGAARGGLRAAAIQTCMLERCSSLDWRILSAFSGRLGRITLGAAARARIFAAHPAGAWNDCIPRIPVGALALAPAKARSRGLRSSLVLSMLHSTKPRRHRSRRLRGAACVLARKSGQCTPGANSRRVNQRPRRCRARLTHAGIQRSTCLRESRPGR